MATSNLEDFRVGTVRQTMKNNPLLAKAELGKVKQSQFNNPPDDHAFGYNSPPDPEGVREVTMLWKEHTPSHGKDARPDGRPNLDFTAMNKLSAMSGLTRADQQQFFRETHPVTVKKGDHTHKPSPGLPSDKDPRHTYGVASSHRPLAVQRVKGPFEPPVKHLIQGAYQEDWMRENMSKDGTANMRPYIPPVPTRAAVGHAIGAQQKYLRHDEGREEWKMTKFKTVNSKVTQYMGTTAARQEEPTALPVEENCA